MQPEIGAVVFDMDGLMLDTEPLYKIAWQAAAADLGYALDDRSYTKLIGRPTGDCERELMAKFGSAFPIDRFRVLWPRLWQAEVTASGIQQKPGLREFLAFSDAHGLPLAVATSSEADYAAFSLRHAGLEGRFDVIVTGDEITCGKPAPDIYLEAARRLQVDPTACVALEDSEPGILASRVEFVGRSFKDEGWSAGLGVFDCIVTHQAVHELRHKRHAVGLHAEVRRLLAPGGFYLVCDHFAGEGGMKDEALYLSVEEHQSALRQAGFTVVKLLMQKGGLALHQAT